VRRSRVFSLAVLAGLTLPAAPLWGQGYRVRIESRFQSVKYRGWQLDSVPATDVVPGPGGGLQTADGYAVTCLTGDTYCRYYTAGAPQQAQPFVTTADLSAWDFGVPGLSARASARVVTDLANPDVWPATQPTLQLVEGYAEYARGLLMAQGGRLIETSRLGYTGFDGARVRVRPLGGKVSAAVYGGWALARGALLGVSDSLLNPLGEFRPSKRGVLFGGDVGWNLRWMQATVRYERETDAMDPSGGTTRVASEQLGTDLVLRPWRGVSVSGGADYDLVFGGWGSAEGQLTVAIPGTEATASVGGRRYRPHFESWSIWGVFSPVPYNAAFGSLTLRLMNRVQVRARGEVYEYANTETATPLVPIENSGWRGSLGATYVRSANLIATADYYIESGPGAGALGIDGSVFWRPIPRVAVRGSIANLQRALELRFNDASVWQYGLDVDAQVLDQFRVFGGVLYYNESRGGDRTVIVGGTEYPDAAQFSWNQVRFNAGIRLSLGTGADRSTLPPAILRIPEGGAR
jgi:hypothetical protein